MLPAARRNTSMGNQHTTACKEGKRRKKIGIWGNGICLVLRVCLPGQEDPGDFGNRLAMRGSEVCTRGEGAAGQCPPL